MTYGAWGTRPARRRLDEKAWSRESLALWDEKWQSLSVPARRFYLEEMKSPARDTKQLTQPSMPTVRFPQEILRELSEAGFVRVEPAKQAGRSGMVFGVHEAHDFAMRMRALRRYKLLRDGGERALKDYVSFCYYAGAAEGQIQKVLNHAKVPTSGLELRESLSTYISNGRWPQWVSAYLSDPVADRILKVIEDAEGSIKLADLRAKLDGTDWDRARSALDRLIKEFVLFEDLDPATLEIEIGSLPTVREQLARMAEPRERPALEIVTAVAAMGPEGSVVVNDLRAFLLDLASEPARLKRDQALFQKEADRLLAAFEPIPDWLAAATALSPEERLFQTQILARELRLASPAAKGDKIELGLTGAGRDWLAQDLAYQYQAVYAFLDRAIPNHSMMAAHVLGPTALIPRVRIGETAWGDANFLGANVCAIPRKTGQRYSYYYAEASVADFKRLRESVYESLSALARDTFCELGSVLAHAAFGPHNPLTVGLDPVLVDVYINDVKVAPIDELRERLGRELLERLILGRLVPLGCFRLGRDDRGRLCVAREPGFDVYFGRKGATLELLEAGTESSKVVVQPDFSVLVIGLNPAPAADLAPFCERAGKSTGAGAVTLKLTREAVVKAVSRGMKPDEIIKRLERHAANAVPTNVLREVQEWSRWVRHVETSTMTVLRCADRETADRVLSALGKQGERVGEKLVAVGRERLSAADQAKLHAQGIIVDGAAGTGAAASRAKTKKKKRRTSWRDW